jgi:phosphoribosylglycinamide formyltransferase-1
VPPRLVVLASGSGSTLQALLDAGLPVVAVGTDVPGCLALQRARSAGIPTFTTAFADYPKRAEWNEALAADIDAYRPDIVVLAGFMKLLAPSVVRRFKIVNTHPAMLPAFPGAHALRDALAAGAMSTGVTVHWVDEGVDTGPVIVQQAVPIEAGDDEDSLRERVQAVEKPLYVQAIRQLCEAIHDSNPRPPCADQRL